MPPKAKSKAKASAKSARSSPARGSNTRSLRSAGRGVSGVTPSLQRGASAGGVLSQSSPTSRRSTRSSALASGFSHGGKAAADAQQQAVQHAVAVAQTQAQQRQVQARYNSHHPYHQALYPHHPGMHAHHAGMQGIPGTQELQQARHAHAGLQQGMHPHAGLQQGLQHHGIQHGMIPGAHLNHGLSVSSSNGLPTAASSSAILSTNALVSTQSVNENQAALDAANEEARPSAGLDSPRGSTAVADRTSGGEYLPQLQTTPQMGQNGRNPQPNPNFNGQNGMAADQMVQNHLNIGQFLPGQTPGQLNLGQMAGSEHQMLRMQLQNPREQQMQFEQFQQERRASMESIDEGEDDPPTHALNVIWNLVTYFDDACRKLEKEKNWSQKTARRDAGILAEYLGDLYEYTEVPKDAEGNVITFPLPGSNTSGGGTPSSGAPNSSQSPSEQTVTGTPEQQTPASAGCIVPEEKYLPEKGLNCFRIGQSLDSYWYELRKEKNPQLESCRQGFSTFKSLIEAKRRKIAVPVEQEEKGIYEG